MRRREFLRKTGLATAGTLVGGARLRAVSGGPSGKRPNLVVIITDQQFADAMSCSIGRDFIHTPNMDSLAATGTRFTKAYCPNPLCIPSRASMFTGRYAHETGIQTNGKEKLDPDTFPCMGRIFNAAGYETGFFGKWHMPYDAKKTDDHGFDVNVGSPGKYDGAPVAEFIVQKRDRPYLAIASFVNPHDICQWARGNPLPGGPIGDPPAPDDCPPLKANLDPPANETDVIGHMRRAYQAHPTFPVGHFSEAKWRQYVWAYYRMVEKVDRQVGTVLNALRKTGQEENTLVAFLSDHGDCHGAHRWNQKTVFYDESARVPLIISQKGTTTAAGVCDKLIQTGVDLIPTLCDFAGVDPPAGLPGRSLRPDALGQAGENDRPYVVVSNHMVQCVPVDGVMMQPQGRMVRSRRYKYCVYDSGRRRESLVDMLADPGEMVNQVANPELRNVLLKHRGDLGDFSRRHDDRVGLSMLAGLDSPNA